MQYQLDRSPRANPIVSFCPEKFLICFAAAVLTFFIIAGLLYLLRFKRVDNLGAYSIPSETGLLIPSVNNSYYKRSSRRADEGRAGDGEKSGLGPWNSIAMPPDSRSL